MLRKTEELKSHPMNEELFRNLPIEQYEALKLDIKNNGIKTALHIKEDGTVLCGHQRVRIAKELGLKEVPVEIKDPNNEREYIIKDNLLRRQLTTEEKAILISDLADQYRQINRPKDDNGRLSQKGRYSELMAKSIYGEDLDQKKLVNEARRIERYVEYAKVMKNYPEIAKKDKSMEGVIREHKKIKFLNKRKNNLTKENLKKLILGDAKEKLKELKENTVDCVIIDPPYGVDYVEMTNTGTVGNSRKLGSANKNFNDDKEDALKLMEEVCPELQRICKDNAHIYVFFGISNYHEIRKILEKYFIIDQVPIIWEKDNFPIGRDVQKQYMLCYENLFFCKNKNNERILNNTSSRNVIKCPVVQGKMHPTQKPVELLKYFIENSTTEGEIVLDCFMGSGSTIIASHQLNRKFIGIEIDEDYYKIALRRLEDEQLNSSQENIKKN